jgi:histidyl-tRNA synthetase
MPPPLHAFQAPKGTRDLYPIDAARRRFIVEAWRSASIRHGFDEIDGPIFEHLDLYTVKSGEEIITQLFSFSREGGEKAYALRPEFTPTLARMFAAKANALPKPTKWFMAGPFFRAERPQRGRLREFLQWNVDLLGDNSPGADAEVIATCVSMLRALGLTPADVRIKVNHRAALSQWLAARGVPEAVHAELFKLLDAKEKMAPAEFVGKLAAYGFSPEQTEVFQKGIIRISVEQRGTDGAPSGPHSTGGQHGTVGGTGSHGSDVLDMTFFSQAVTPLAQQLVAAGIIDWIDFDLSIVRGLAYYTGMVFEVHEAGGKERAIAGGGRYDNLVELFGGPPTPAVGFGMGDVVLSLVLQDKGLMPNDTDLLGKVGARPDVFVISNGQPQADAQLRPMVASFREVGFHARHSYKTTKNVGKLLQDAASSGARFAVIIESDQSATVKDMASGTQLQVPIAAIVEQLNRSLGR